VPAAVQKQKNSDLNILESWKVEFFVGRPEQNVVVTVFCSKPVLRLVVLV
jgi:hypothetical protein